MSVASLSWGEDAPALARLRFRQSTWRASLCVTAGILGGCASGPSSEPASSIEVPAEAIVINVRNPNPEAMAVYVWWGPSSRRLPLGTVSGNGSSTFTTRYLGPELAITSNPASRGTRREEAPQRFRSVTPGERINTTLLQSR